MLKYGLTIAETETYTSKRLDYAQMKVHSACLRNGYPENVRECITKEGLTGEQMAVALEFYEKGVPIETVAEITGNSSQTAFVMKKLLRNSSVVHSCHSSWTRITHVNRFFLFLFFNFLLCYLQ